MLSWNKGSRGVFWESVTLTLGVDTPEHAQFKDIVQEEDGWYIPGHAQLKEVEHILKRLMWRTDT